MGTKTNPFPASKFLCTLSRTILIMPHSGSVFGKGAIRSTYSLPADALNPPAHAVLSASEITDLPPSCVKISRGFLLITPEDPPFLLRTRIERKRVQKNRKPFPIIPSSPNYPNRYPTNHWSSALPSGLSREQTPRGHPLTS